MTVSMTVLEVPPSLPPCLSVKEGLKDNRTPVIKAAMYHKVTDAEDAALREESRVQFCASRPINTQYAYATGIRNYEVHTKYAGASTTGCLSRIGWEN